MKLLPLCFVAPIVLLGQQQILEDFACATASAVAGASRGPTTLSCLDGAGNPQAHGFTNGMHVQIWGATGAWAPMNNQTLQYLHLATAAGGTTMYFNDTGTIENTAGSTWQLYPGSTAASCNTGEVITLTSVVDSRKIGRAH